MQKTAKKICKNEYRRIPFTDKKIFSTEEKFNLQNDRVYEHSCFKTLEKAPHIQHGHHPLSDDLVGCVMAWSDSDSFM